MDRAARIRWTVLLAALATTVAAILYPEQHVRVREESRVTTIRSTVPLVSASLSEDMASTASRWEPLEDDPFAPRRWQVPAEAIALVPPAPVPTALAPTPPAVIEPPALPFQFVGRLKDSTQDVVYLSRGDRAVLARMGEVLDETYKVLEITDSQVSFEYLPTGQKQALVVPSRDN